MPFNIEDPTPNPYQDADANWGYTEQAREIEEMRRRIERESGHKERHTIGRDTRIDGGVYEGKYGGEAIVVDREKYSHGYEQAYSAILQEATAPDGQVDKNVILGATYQYVHDHMMYDTRGVDRIFKEDCKGVDGQKIALESYIQRGVGVCRHQALFVGMILEGFADQGVLGGNVSVDRNMVKKDRDDKYDGHAWVRYTNSSGTVYILDVAQGRLAKLNDLAAARARGEDVWNYERPEDKSKKIGGEAVRYVARLPKI